MNDFRKKLEPSHRSHYRGGEAMFADFDISPLFRPSIPLARTLVCFCIAAFSPDSIFILWYNKSIPYIIKNIDDADTDIFEIIIGGGKPSMLADVPITGDKLTGYAIIGLSDFALISLK